MYYRRGVVKFVGGRVHAGLGKQYRHRMLGLQIEAADVAGHVLGSWGQAVADDRLSFGSTEQEAALKKQTVHLV